MQRRNKWNSSGSDVTDYILDKQS